MVNFLKINVGRNQALARAVFTVLQTMGYPVAGVQDHVTRLQATLNKDHSIWVPLNSKNGVTYSETSWLASGNYAQNVVLVDHSSAPEVKLNSEYTAVVSADKKTVKVGCQDIPATKIDELYKLIHS